MNSHPTIHELREAIDACRPGSADLALPELARLAEAAERDPEVAAELARGQRFDGLLAEALDDVPVPAGLAERLLARAAPEYLKASVQSAVESSEPAAAATAVSLPPTAEATVANEATPQDRSTRRGLLWRLAVAGSTALAIVVIAFVAGPLAWGPSAPRVVSQQDLLVEVDGWMNAPAQGNLAWRPMTAKVPAGFSKPTSVVVPPRQWRSFKTGEGDAAVAYELSSVPGSRATLFVVATEARYPVGPLPFTTVPGATGGRQVAGWQSATHLYVLVIDQGPPVDRYLRRPSVG
jgi:hypothetical protein